MKYNTLICMSGRVNGNVFVNVCKLGRFYILKSYRNIVAAIDTCDDNCYDFLRLVYGYTATSAQRIAKFRNDYGAGKWGCANVLTWRGFHNRSIIA